MWRLMCKPSKILLYVLAISFSLNSASVFAEDPRFKKEEMKKYYQQYQYQQKGYIKNSITEFQTLFLLSGRNNDYMTVATRESILPAWEAGFEMVRKLGRVYKYQKEGTIPLKLYWSPKNSDHFTAIPGKSEQSAINAGYKFVRIEGYIYPMDPDGGVAQGSTKTVLQLYWNPQRRDNFTATEKAVSGKSAWRYAYSMGYLPSDEPIPESMEFKFEGCTWFKSRDCDGDGHKKPKWGGDDCDDLNANRFPGNPEVCDADGIDEDCDATTVGNRDVDGDGFIEAMCCNSFKDSRGKTKYMCGTDCDDYSKATYPGSMSCYDDQQISICNYPARNERKKVIQYDRKVQGPTNTRLRTFLKCSEMSQGTNRCVQQPNETGICMP